MAHIVITGAGLGGMPAACEVVLQIPPGIVRLAAK